MIIFKTARDLQQYLDKTRGGETMTDQRTGAGFVPTMGDLHDGHLSLLKSSGSENAVTVCSIFVNPAQLYNPKDFEKYPTKLVQDINKLEFIVLDVLFLSTV